MTCLLGAVKGQSYKLYLIEDIFSRFPVGWEVRAEETGELAADLIQHAVLRQRCASRPLVLHADNGAPMKSYSLKAKLEALATCNRSWIDQVQLNSDRMLTMETAEELIAA